MLPDVTDKTFSKLVLDSAQPVLVVLWAPWCGPCRMLEPVVEELAKDNSGKVQVLRLNTDEQPETCAAYRVSAIPTLLFFKAGKLAVTRVGVTSNKDMQRELDALLS